MPSARLPRQSSISASSQPCASASCLAIVQIMYRPEALASTGAVFGAGRAQRDHSMRMPLARASGEK